jgi:membrane-associated phospholipid phosphatase
VVVAAVGLAVASIIGLRPFDARITGGAAGWVMPDSLAWAAIDQGLRLGLVALVVAAAAATAAPWRALGWALLLIGGGNLFAELLKTAIERARPSDVPLGAGNSLPSGHVLGCTVTALVAIGLLRRVGWSRRTRTTLAALAVAAVLAEGAIRVARGSHWPSDIPASILLGVAWVVGANAAVAAGPRIAAAWGLTLAAGYAFFLLNPAWRLQVP